MPPQTAPLRDKYSNGADAFQQYGMGYNGERSSFSEQLQQHANGGAPRKYMRQFNRSNPITNPEVRHVV